MACSFQGLEAGRATVAPLTDTFSVSLPILVNNLAIKAGNEVILKWKTVPEKKKSPPVVSAVTQLQQAEKRQRTAKAKLR